MGAILYRDKVYGAGGAGGGSTVTITPTLSSGTKIADFEIDGEPGELYAPQGGGGSGYSETILFSGDYGTNAELQLSGDINDYDAIKIWFGWAGSSIGGKFPVIVSVTEFTTDFTYTSSPGTATPHLFCFLYSSQYLRIARASDDTKLRVFDSHSGAIKKVVGIKY